VATVREAEQIGALVRSVPVPKQANDPDITVRCLDLYTEGFVVRCDVGSGARLKAAGLVALDLHDSLYTRYEQVASGEDFVSYQPAIPASAEWIEVHTKPETHIDLRNRTGV
jgi:hypothetical protein